jgi:apolipoprotein N-acyltransferase
MAVFFPKFRRRFPRGWIWLAPALVVASEFLLPQIFPYMQGLTHYRVVPVFQLASITGVYGITYLLLLSNCVVFHTLSWWRQGKPFSWKPVLSLVLIIVMVLGYGLWRQSLYNRRSQNARELKAGLIQSNITPYAHRQLGSEKIRELYLKMSRQAADEGADWIIWSEGEFKTPLNLPEAAKTLTQESRQLKRPILLGGFYFKYRQGKRFLCNSAIHVDPENGMGKRYDKRFLVPFGEYKPFEKQLGFIYRHIDHRLTVYPGDDPVVQKLQGIPYAFLICYEAIFPALVRESVNAGARLLVNITYDAWFGRTSAPFQHLLLASARSVENGVPMIRLGTTGISTVVDSLGRMSILSPLFTRRVLVYPVRIVKLPSLYSRIGDLFSWLCVTMAALAWLWLWFPPFRRQKCE